MLTLDHYPFAVFIHILGALGLFVALALELLAARGISSAATRSIARRIGALSMALLVLPGALMTFTRWNFLGWPAAGLIGMVAIVAVGLSLNRRQALQVWSVQIRIALALGVVAVMVFKRDLLSSLVILAAASLLGVGFSLVAQRRVRHGRSHLRAGSAFPERELESISGERIRIPDPAHMVHLQFRRFAGCPVCNLHLRSIVRRHAEVVGAGIREVVVFHSSREELLEHAADLPFAVIADPHKKLYAEFGVEASPRALLDPRVWLPIVVGVTRSAVAIVRKQGRAPKLVPTGGRLGLPADFLIASDGRVTAVKYGSHAYDQWSVDDLLAFAQQQTGNVQMLVTGSAATQPLDGLARASARTQP